MSSTMLLHQTATHNLVSSLGSKGHPIVIDVQDEPTTLAKHFSGPSPPSVPPPSFSLPPAFSAGPSKLSRHLSNPIAGMGKEPLYSDSGSMTQTMEQDEDELQQIDFVSQEHEPGEAPGKMKRKRDAVDESEESQSSAAKQVKKVEKKRRRRERRAARVAQLVDKMPSSNGPLRGLEPPNSDTWGTPQSLPPIHLNFNTLSGHFDLDHDMSYFHHLHQQSHFPLFPDPNFVNMDMDITSIGDNRLSQHNLESTSPPLHSDVSHSAFQDDEPVNRPFFTHSGKASLLERLSNAPDHPDSFYLKQDTVEQDTFVPDNFPPGFSLQDIISSKQNLLDGAISENKEALAQLSVPTTPEQRANLMKAFSERNKLIARLTSEIKEHFAALKLAPAPSAPSVCSKFRWPETQFPLYVILSSDDEDSDSDG